MQLSTYGNDDTVKNSFGLATGHAYALIQTFVMKMEDGTTRDMVMIRNPWGKTYYKGPWSKDDAKWKKAFYKKQVPQGIDPSTSHGKGVFVAEASIFKKSKSCFRQVSITHLKDH